MTDEVYEERPLVRVKGAPLSPSRELSIQKERRLKKAARAEVVSSDTGENAGQIIGAWATWYKEGSGVPVPQSVIARMGKQVRELLALGYTAKEVKYGLGFWTLEEMDNPNLSPQLLDRFVWRYARDTNAQAKAWRDGMKARMNEFGISTTQTTAKERREAGNITATREWKRKETNPWR